MNKLLTESEVLEYIGVVLESSDIDSSAYKLAMIIKLLKITGWLE